MRLLKSSQLATFIGLSLASSAVFADNTPAAESLVGKTYLGGHGMYIKTDTDRLFTTNPNSEIDHGSGIGAELGYRISEFYEARLSLTDLNLNADHPAYDIPSGSSVAMDLLYFPNKANFYVVGGADFLDIDKSNLSADLGMGYRHYFSQNTALYVEGKGHYQLDDNYTDFSSKIGFIYYFGVEAASAKKPLPVNKVAAVTPVDSDKDGVIDSRDKCPSTPMVDKVDANGCTIFTKKREVIDLLINFDNDKSAIKPKYKAEVARVAKFMKLYPHSKLVINGHTSSVGSAKHNEKLSQSRAQAVVDMLVNGFGIAATRLEAKGYGESQLLNTANTAKAHAENRRIQATMKVTKKYPEKR